MFVDCKFLELALISVRSVAMLAFELTFQLRTNSSYHCEALLSLCGGGGGDDDDHDHDDDDDDDDHDDHDDHDDGDDDDYDYDYDGKVY